MIDANGDLLLKVGAKLVVRPWFFLVCSAALRRSSAVWKSMLFGPWIEAKPIEGDWIVDLPEDNPESFGVLLAILHGTFSAVPSAVSLDFLCAILVLAGKYNWIHLLHPYIDRWAAAVKNPNLKVYYKSKIPTLGFTGSNHIRRIYAAWELGCDDLVAEEITGFIFSFSCTGTTFFSDKDGPPTFAPSHLVPVTFGDHPGPPDVVGKQLASNHSLRCPLTLGR